MTSLPNDDPRLAILREAEAVPVTVVAAKYGISAKDIYEWRERWGNVVEYERFVTCCRSKNEVAPSSIDALEGLVANTRQEFTLTLYRGFRARSVGRTALGDYVFSPAQSEDGVLWFTHEFIHSYRGQHVEYASDHGTYLLTYPLPCWRHVQLRSAPNGAKRSDVPHIISSIEGHWDTRFLDGIELPHGWFFSYKIERFVCCSREIVAPKKMVKRIRRYDG